MRTFDVTKIRDVRMIGEQGQAGKDRNIGLGLPIPQYHSDANPAKGSSLPPSLHTQDMDERLDDPSRSRTPFGGRRTSIKDAFRRQRNSLGHGRRTPDPNIATPNMAPSPYSLAGLAIEDDRMSSPLVLPRPTYLDVGSRHTSHSSDEAPSRDATAEVAAETASLDVATTTLRPPPTNLGTSVPSWYGPDLDEDVKATLLAMQPASRSQSRGSAEVPVPSAAALGGSVRTSPVKTRAVAEQDIIVAGDADMGMLRRVASQPGNQYCVDCKRSLDQENSQRWATISLHSRPTCAFLCIRCAGVHRSLGTHISKVRSPDLDRWTADAILIARAWGNARSNSIWERTKETGVGPVDECAKVPPSAFLLANNQGHSTATALKTFIEDKYIRGKWLSEEDRNVYMSVAP